MNPLEHLSYMEREIERDIFEVPIMTSLLFSTNIFTEWDFLSSNNGREGVWTKCFFKKGN